MYRIGDDGLTIAGESDLTAEDLLSPVRLHAQPRDYAVRFLQEILAGGPMSTREVHEAASLEGISPRTLERAKEALGVVCKPSGYQQPWNWELRPSQAPAAPPIFPAPAGLAAAAT